jgi:AmmeMemoRadiSam system protein B
MYSGAVAGKAYQHWQHNTVITPIVFLLGPVHYEWTTINVGSYDFFATPFGEIPINTDLCGELARQGVEVTNAPHLREHSLEVQLPFLQKTLGEFSLVPLVCGDIFPQEIATLLSPYWQRPDCLFVISSDLSHFHTYSEALSLDQESLRVIVEQDFENLENIDGCGRLPIQVSMHLAQQTSATILPFAYANSGDITGEKDSVVGYGALGVV